MYYLNIVMLQKVTVFNFDIWSSEISVLFAHIADPKIPGLISSVGYLQKE